MLSNMSHRELVIGTSDGTSESGSCNWEELSHHDDLPAVNEKASFFPSNSKPEAKFRKYSLRGGTNNGEPPVDQPYTKWQASSNDVRVNITMEKSRCGPFPVPPKKVLIGLIVLGVVSILLGFIIGYLVGWSVHKSPNESGNEAAPVTAAGFTMSKFEQVKGQVTSEDIRAEINDFERRPIVPGTLDSASEVNRVQREWSDYGFPSVVNARQMLFPNNFTFTMRQTQPSGTVISVDTSGSSPVFYGESGTAEGNIVFANFGTDIDFQLLFNQNINVTGNICVIFLGTDDVVWGTVNRASMWGAVGVIFFASPTLFPNVNPAESVAVNGKRLMGDPLTPSLGVQPAGTFQLPVMEALEQPSIPSVVLPANMIAAIASVSSANSIPAHSSPTGSMYQFTVTYTYEARPASTAILGVAGVPVADKFVFVGTHHDQVNPGEDPATGRAIHNTVVHTLTKAIKDGIWKPRRSLIFVSFDASTMDMGAKEWLEENRMMFEERGVAYFNLAGAVTGSEFHLKSSDVLRNVGTSAAADLGISGITTSETLTGQGDFVAFTDYLGVPAFEMKYVADRNLSNFQTVNSTALPNGEQWITNLVHTHINAIMRMCDALILPYDLDTLIATLEEGQAMLTAYNETSRITGVPEQLAALGAAIRKTKTFLTRFNGKIAAARNDARTLSDIKLRVINDIQQAIFRVFLTGVGVPMVRKAQVEFNPNNRNTLTGRVSQDATNVYAFPGLKELFEAIPYYRSSPLVIMSIERAIQTHISEIIASVDLAFDYVIRAVASSDLFQYE